MTFGDLINLAKRFFVTLSLVLLFAVTTCGYTIVMRGGKRIEIPEQFAVTRTTLTYAVAPGINVALQMMTIDIPATERANHELPGSFSKRAEGAKAAPQTPAVLTSPGITQEKRRTVTDRDLEPYKRVRLEGEATYEKRRIELGLPSLEESRRRIEQHGERAWQEAVRQLSEAAREENYWRARAAELRGEIEATDAEIRYIRAFLSASETSFPGSSPLFALQSSALSLANRTFSPPRPRVFVAPSGRMGIADRSGRSLNRGPFPFNPGAQRLSSRIVGGSLLRQQGAVVFGSYGRLYDSSYDRETLSGRLGQLFAYRAGLEARLRALEEEARRAGVPPGWLR